MSQLAEVALSKAFVAFTFTGVGPCRSATGCHANCGSRILSGKPPARYPITISRMLKTGGNASCIDQVPFEPCAYRKHGPDSQHLFHALGEFSRMGTTDEKCDFATLFEKCCSDDACSALPAVGAGCSYVEILDS